MQWHEVSSRGVEIDFYTGQERLCGDTRDGTHGAYNSVIQTDKQNQSHCGRYCRESGKVDTNHWRVGGQLKGGWLQSIANAPLRFPLVYFTLRQRDIVGGAWSIAFASTFTHNPCRRQIKPLSARPP